MELQLFVKDQLVETIPLDLTKCLTYEDRWSRIQVVCDWLKYKYAQTIVLVPNWRIELVITSKF